MESAYNRKKVAKSERLSTNGLSEGLKYLYYRIYNKGAFALAINLPDRSQTDASWEPDGNHLAVSFS
jgi:hypothetical protein